MRKYAAFAFVFGIVLSAVAQAPLAIYTDNLVNGFQDWNWRRFCCSSIASENRGADTKVQIAATETLRTISAVTRKKSR